jgi:PII-like signaling protein
MQGFQLIFMTEQNRRIEGKVATEWLLKAAKEIGCSGATSFSGTEGYGKDGRRHSAHFIELADQPVQVMIACTQEQSMQLFAKINAVNTKLFYTKSAIEFGSVGGEEPSDS